jgi:hypothetical protein
MLSIVYICRLPQIGTTVVIISLVRKYHTCFCADIRRLNLATGRVGDTLYVVGNHQAGGTF